MKHIPLYFMLLIVFQLLGCSEDAVNHSEKIELKESEISNQNSKKIEEYSELYFMHGIQISKRFCYLGHPDICEEGDVIDSDTLNTAFLVRVTFSSDKPDTVLFDGLEGANTKPREMVSDGFNGGSAAYLNCTGPSTNCGYVQKIGNELEFDLNSPGGSYVGTGTLDNDRLTLQTQYYYRGSGADYILEGHKIVEKK